MNAISEIERDLCLAEDVLKDAAAAWDGCLAEPLTPRNVQRLVAAKRRLDAVADQVRDLRVGMHQFVIAAQRELAA